MTAVWLAIVVTTVGVMSAEAKLADDPSGLRFLADNEFGQSRRAAVEYVRGDETLPTRLPLSAPSPPINRMTKSMVITPTTASWPSRRRVWPSSSLAVWP